MEDYLVFQDVLVNKVVDIPGLDRGYVPQGIDYVSSNVLITMYDGREKKKGIRRLLRRRNSVIFLIEEGGKSVKRVVLDGKFHVGGIACDRNTNSVFVTGDDGFIYRYCLDDVLHKRRVRRRDEYRVADGDLISLTNGKSSCAYLSIYGKYLYVGNFNEGCKNIIKVYEMVQNGRVSLEYVKTIFNPYSLTQGLCIGRYKEREYYLFSCSYGRKRNSKLYVSRLIGEDLEKKREIIMPCMAEGLCFDDEGNIALVFESGASKFKGAKTEIKSVLYLDFEKVVIGK